MSQLALAETRVPFIERFFGGGDRVIGLHDFERELLFSLERMRPGCRGTAEQQWIIARHQLIGDAHQLPEHVCRGLVDRDKVAETFAHFFGAIQTFKNRKEKNDLLRKAFLLLEVAAYQNIKKLVRSTELDIGLHHH